VLLAQFSPNSAAVGWRMARYLSLHDGLLLSIVFPVISFGFSIPGKGWREGFFQVACDHDDGFRKRNGIIQFVSGTQDFN